MPIFYLSFQRAPPTSVSPDGIITISPTIVNDLRDEVYQPEANEGILKITLAWTCRHQRTWRRLSGSEQIVWEGPRSAYKPCQIKVPDKASLHGLESIHLALWAAIGCTQDAKLKHGGKSRDDQLRCTFDIATLSSPVVDRLDIIPVLSAPISVLSKGVSRSAFGTKSTSTVRLFQIEGSPIIEISEESGYELDKHIWDASLYMISYISKSTKACTLSEIMPAENTSTVRKGLRIVELGAGTGMVTVVLSNLLAQASIEFDADNGAIQEGATTMTATDLSSALPLLEHNIAVNEGTSCKSAIHCRPLDWLDDCQIEGTSLILVSDCTYNPTYFKPLCKTIKSLMSKGGPSAVCLLAKKHRHDDEEALWEEVKINGLQAVLLAGQQAICAGHWGLWRLREAL